MKNLILLAVAMAAVAAIPMNNNTQSTPLKSLTMSNEVVAVSGNGTSDDYCRESAYKDAVKESCVDVSTPELNALVKEIGA